MGSANSSKTVQKTDVDMETTEVDTRTLQILQQEDSPLLSLPAELIRKLLDFFFYEMIAFTSTSPTEMAIYQDFFRFICLPEVLILCVFPHYWSQHGKCEKHSAILKFPEMRLFTVQYRLGSSNLKFSVWPKTLFNRKLS